MVFGTHKGKSARRDELIEHLRPQVAKWWLPDDMVVIDEMPYTATGKIRKADLRKAYANYLHSPEKLKS